MKPFNDSTPELGRTLAYVSRYWRPAIATEKCPYCGRKFYHMQVHIRECEMRPDDIKRRDADFSEWYAKQKALDNAGDTTKGRV